MNCATKVTGRVAAWLIASLAVIASCVAQQEPEPEPPGTPGATNTGQPCDPADFQERCEGEALFWCNKDHVTREDCAATGDVCRQGLFGPKGYCYKPCGKVTEAGHCEGNRQAWCNAGALIHYDCGKDGPPEAPAALCAWLPEQCSIQCLGCGDVPAAGRCTGDVLEQCQNGGYTRRDCAKDSAKCVADNGTGKAACQLATACDPAKTGCDGQVARWCEGKTGHWQNCAALGLHCVQDSNATGQPVCEGCNVAWWDKGCHFGWRKACVENVLQWEPCAEVCHVAP